MEVVGAGVPPWSGVVVAGGAGVAFGVEGRCEREAGGRQEAIKAESKRIDKRDLVVALVHLQLIEAYL